MIKTSPADRHPPGVRFRQFRESHNCRNCSVLQSLNHRSSMRSNGRELRGLSLLLSSMLMANNTRSVVFIEEPLPFSHTFVLKVTPRALTAAQPSVRTCSSFFTGAGHMWRIVVYLGGETASSSSGHVGVFLEHTPAAPGVAVKVDFNIAACGKSSPSAAAASGAKEFKDGERIIGWARMLTHAAAEAWLKNHANTLEITATVQLVSFATKVPDVVPAVPPPALAGQLRSLLAGGDGADCTLVCGGERFPAHSLVLSLRSPVFQAQLVQGGPLAAVNLASVPVPTEIQPPVLRKLLDHAYTDEEVEFADANEAQHLLNASDHYGLVRLRCLCERFLASNLTVDNAALILTLADQHTAAGLRESAERFIAAHTAEVVMTEGWADLAETRPQFAYEVLIGAVTGGGKKKRGAAAALGAGSGEGEGSNKQARTA